VHPTKYASIPVSIYSLNEEEPDPKVDVIMKIDTGSDICFGPITCVEHLGLTPSGRVSELRGIGGVTVAPSYHAEIAVGSLAQIPIPLSLTNDNTQHWLLGHSFLK
jgi:hypothetical protein